LKKSKRIIAHVQGEAQTEADTYAAARYVEQDTKSQAKQEEMEAVYDDSKVTV
jgi:hypothetical protein